MWTWKLLPVELSLRNTRITRIFLQRLPMKNHSNLSIIEKRQNKAKYLTRNFIPLKFVKKTSIPNPSKVWDMPIAATLVAPDFLKTCTIQSDTAVRWSAVDTEDLKPYSKSEKATFLEVINKTIIDKTKRRVRFSQKTSLQCSQVQGPQIRPSNSLQNKISSDTCWRVHRLVYMKVQAHISSEQTQV